MTSIWFFFFHYIVIMLIELWFELEMFNFKTVFIVSCRYLTTNSFGTVHIASRRFNSAYKGRLEIKTFDLVNTKDSEESLHLTYH